MKQCAICGKQGKKVGRRVKLRGKYNPTASKRKQPNLQLVKIPVNVNKKGYKNFAGKRILACSKCIKAMGKIK